MEPLGRRRYESAEDGMKYLERLIRHNTNPQFVRMVRDGDSVHREFGRLFHPDNLHRLKATEFKEFLLYEHNRHWWGIHRHQAKLVADMDRLRTVLGLLLDESSPIEERLNRIEPTSGPKPLPGLGKAVFTPILHVVYPSTYGVWNSVAESAMQRLNLAAIRAQRLLRRPLRVRERGDRRCGQDAWSRPVDNRLSLVAH